MKMEELDKIEKQIADHRGFIDERMTVLKSLEEKLLVLAKAAKDAQYIPVTDS